MLPLVSASAKEARSHRDFRNREADRTGRRPAGINTRAVTATSGIVRRAGNAPARSVTIGRAVTATSGIVRRKWRRERDSNPRDRAVTATSGIVRRW